MRWGDFSNFELSRLSSVPHLLALSSIHHFFNEIDQVYQMINCLN